MSVNGTQPTNCSSSRGNFKAEVIGKTFAYCLIFVVSITGNFLVGVVVYKRKGMRKTINVFIVNMAMSDFIYPVFVFSAILTQLYVDRWLIGGSLGEIICKVVSLLRYASASVSI